MFTDCEDGDRVTDEEHAALDSAGIVFGQLTDVWPDAFYIMSQRTHFGLSKLSHQMVKSTIINT